MGCLVQTVALAAHASEAALKFAQLSDIHMMNQGPDGSWLLLANAPELLDDWMAQIQQKRDIQFVVVTGNAVNSPNAVHFDRLCSVLKKYPIPVYFALGNRDVAGAAKSAVIQRLMAEKAPGFISTDQGYYAVDISPTARLLVLDSTPGAEAGRASGRGQLGKPQLDWLHQELEREANQPAPKTVIVAMHHPVMEPYASPSRRLVEGDRAQLQKTLDGSPLVSMVLSGAYHASKIQQKGAVLHINTPSLVDYPMAGRIITVNNDGRVSVDWLPSRLTALVAKSKSRSPWVAVAAGTTPSDQRWQGGLKYFPTPQAVAQLKTQQNLKRLAVAQATAQSAAQATAKGIKKPAMAADKDALSKLLPKPAPMVVEVLR